jgi:hypothetical protein
MRAGETQMPISKKPPVGSLSPVVDMPVAVMLFAEWLAEQAAQQKTTETELSFDSEGVC